MNPTAAERSVCPTPQNIAYRGAILMPAALYKPAMTALLTIPDVIGVNTPIHNINIGQNLEEKKIDKSKSCLGRVQVGILK